MPPASVASHGPAGTRPSRVVAGVAAVLLGCSPRPPAAPTTVDTAPVAAAPLPASEPPPLELAQLAALERVEELALYVEDPRPEARRVVAASLARHAGPEAIEPLGRLATDPEVDVAAIAIARLGAIPTARPTLRVALARREPDDEPALIDALSTRAGAVGLVALLTWLPQEAKTRWYRQERVFRTIDALDDPRGADALLAFLAERPHPHFVFRAAAALGRLGDLRAAPALAARLRQDPLELYSDAFEWEVMLQRDDNERVIAARLLADLALLHPDQRGALRAEAEADLLAWLREKPWPHANGMRALAELGTVAGLPELRAWASPQVPLPRPGQQPPVPEEWVIAQSALRYVGRLRDEASRPALLAALEARPRHIDVTMAWLMHGNVAILGRSLRALGVGAADGLAEWGDPAAFPPLLRYVADPMNNEQSRLAACHALGWVASERDTARLVDEVMRYRQATSEDEFRRACLLEGLGVRGVLRGAERLLPLLEPPRHPDHRTLAARALGRGGLEPALEAALVRRMRSGKGDDEVALALLLGGSTSAVKDSLGDPTGSSPLHMERMRELWRGSFTRVTTDDLERGHLYRAIRNADTAAGLDRVGEPQTWAREELVAALADLAFDAGPHTLTRVVLRKRLLDLARGADAERRREALRALRYLSERGTLQALAAEGGAECEFIRAQLAELG